MFSYIKISKDSSAKYHQKRKDCKKRLMKDIKIYIKKKRKKEAMWSWAIQRSSWRWKTKGWLSIEKIILKKGKMLYDDQNRTFFITIVCGINIFFVASEIYVDASKHYRCIFHFILSTCKYIF